MKCYIFFILILFSVLVVEPYSFAGRGMVRPIEKKEEPKPKKACLRPTQYSLSAPIEESSESSEEDGLECDPEDVEMGSPPQFAEKVEYEYPAHLESVRSAVANEFFVWGRLIPDLKKEILGKLEMSDLLAFRATSKEGIKLAKEIISQEKSKAYILRPRRAEWASSAEEILKHSRAIIGEKKGKIKILNPSPTLLSTLQKEDRDLDVEIDRESQVLTHNDFKSLTLFGMGKTPRKNSTTVALLKSLRLSKKLEKIAFKIGDPVTLAISSKIITELKLLLESGSPIRELEVHLKNLEEDETPLRNTTS